MNGYTADDTAVLVATLRGRDDPTTVLIGKGGIKPGHLFKVDLGTYGKTFLWQRVDDLLLQLSEHKDHGLPNMRIVLLDLTGSMSKNKAMLKRMWSSIPTHGIKARGIEILIVTDGHDNESVGALYGSAGLVELIVRIKGYGYDVGGDTEGEDAITDSAGTPSFAKVNIMLLDVGGGAVTNELAKLGACACIMATQDPDVVARVMRKQRPVRLRRAYTSKDITETWDELTASEEAEVKGIEKYLHGNRANLNLIELFKTRIDPIEDPVARTQAKQQIIEILHAILAGETRTVNRKGEKKNRSHSELNAILYDLERWGGTAVNKDVNPRTWSRGVMADHLAEQLADLEQATPALSPVAEVTAMEEFMDQDEAGCAESLKKRSRGELEELCLELTKQLKKAKN